MRVLLTIKIISAIFAKTGLGMIPTTSNFTLQAKKNRHLFQSVSPQFAAKKAAENEKKKEEARKQATDQLVKLIHDDQRTYWDFIDPRIDYLPERIAQNRKEYRSHIEPIIRKAKELISKGTDVNVLVDYSRQLPCPEGRVGCQVWHGEIEKRPLLTNVILKGFPELIKLLLEAGADPKQRGKYIEESDPFFAAMRVSFDKDGWLKPRSKLIIEYLLDHGADVNVGLQAALTMGNKALYSFLADFVNYFIKAGANVNLKSLNDGTTPLILAAMGYHPDFVKSYLNRGADPNIANSFGDTALIVLVKSGNMLNTIENIQALISAGADVNHRGSGGQVALINFIYKSHKWFEYDLSHWTKIPIKLLQAGADPSIKDNSGKSAFDYAQVKLNNARSDIDRSNALTLIELLNNSESIRKQALNKIA